MIARNEVRFSIAAGPGGLGEKLVEAVLTGHGRMLLTITTSTGRVTRLDCLDIDYKTRAEYGAWSKQ